LVLGLAGLTKGLVAAALVGVSYGGYLLATQRLTVAACLRGVGALIVAGLLASSWYIAMEHRHAGYLYYYFVERHVLGFATDTQRHADEPFWFYLPILLWGGLPWVIYLPAGMREWWLRRNEPLPKALGRMPRGGGLALVLCWLVGSTLLMTAARSKLITYIWPAFPPLAILIGVVWGRMIEGRLTDSARLWLKWSFRISCLIGPVLLPIGMLVAQVLLDLEFPVWIWVLGATAGLLSWVPLFIWHAGGPAQALAAGGMAVGAQFVVVMAVFAPLAARANSAVDLAQYFNHRGHIPSHLVLVEDRIGSLVFYLDPELRASLRKSTLESIRARALPVVNIHEPDALIAMADEKAATIQRYVDLHVAQGQRAGRFRLYNASELRAMQATSAYRYNHLPRLH
jgi:hypothetical protein